MKKMIVFMMTMVMLLSLTGCTETAKHAKLYEKYVDVIGSLESKEYHQAISQIAVMAAEEQAEAEKAQKEEEKAAVARNFADDWFVWEREDNHESAPKKVTISADHTCVIDGKEMKWMESNSDTNRIEGVIVDGKENQFYFSYYENPDVEEVRELRLYTCQVNEWGISADDYVAGYLKNAMFQTLFTSWRLMDGDEGMPNYFYVNRQNMNHDDKRYRWEVLSEDTTDALTIHAVGTENTADEYTLELVKKDGHYVMTMTGDQSGALGFYYNDVYGYEESWPEYRYPRAKEYLESYINYNSFWTNDKSYSKHEAGAYLVEVFTGLGDYKDSAQIVNRFTIYPQMLRKVEVHRTDNLGNDSTDRLEYYEYDDKGRMVLGYHRDMHRMYGVKDYWGLHFSYNDKEQISQIQYGNVTAVITPSYDGAGRMIAATAQYNTAAYEYGYTYDEAGRMISGMNYDSNDDWHQFTYSYDDAGRLLQCVEKKEWREYTYVTDYTYDEKGYLTGMRKVTSYNDPWDGWTVERDETITYTNDEQGRPIGGKMTVEGENKYTKQDIVYTYEDLYFYDAE